MKNTVSVVHAFRRMPWPLVAVLCIAAALRLDGLTREALWTDEAYSAWAATLPLDVLLGPPFDNHFQLHYLVQRPFVALFGAEAGVRVPALLAGLLLPLAMHALLRRAGQATALAGALLVALHGPSIRYAQEGRAYALLELLIVLAAWALLEGVDRLRRQGVAPWRTWLAHGAVLALAVHVHVIGVLYTAILAATGFLLCLRAAGPAQALRFAGVHGAVALACLPWLRTAATFAGDPESFVWLVQPTLNEAFETWVRATVSSQIWPAPVALAAFGLLLALPGAWLLWRRGQRDLAAVGLALALSPVLIWLFGFVKPVLVARTLLPAAMGNVILWAGLVPVRLPASGRRSWRDLAPAACVVVVALMLARSLVAGAGVPVRGHWRELTTGLRQAWQPGDHLVIGDAYSWMVTRLYLPDTTSFTVALPLRGLLVPSDAGRVSAYWAMDQRRRPKATDEELIALLHAPDVRKAGSGGPRRWWYLHRGKDWKVFHDHLSRCVEAPRVDRFIRTAGDIHAIRYTGIARECGFHAGRD